MNKTADIQTNIGSNLNQAEHLVSRDRLVNVCVHKYIRAMHDHVHTARTRQRLAGVSH